MHLYLKPEASLDKRFEWLVCMCLGNRFSATYAQYTEKEEIPVGSFFYQEELEATVAMCQCSSLKYMYRRDCRFEMIPPPRHSND